MAEELLRSLVQDYLCKAGLSETLASFRRESGALSGFGYDSDAAWMEIAAKLQLPEADSDGTRSVLARLVESYVKDCSLRMRVSSEALFTKLAAKPKPSRPVNQRTSPRQGDVVDVRAPVKGVASPIEPNPSGKQDLSPLTRHSPTQRHSSKELESSAKEGSTRRKSRGRDKRFVKTGVNALPVSSENWLPFRMRMDSVGRSMLIAHANLQTARVHCASNDKYRGVSNLTEYRQFLVQEELLLKKRLSCGCCEVKFPSINFPMQVSLKAILDRRKKWDASYDTGSTTTLLTVAPRNYDQVDVCLFCAQFFHDQVLIFNPLTG